MTDPDGQAIGPEPLDREALAWVRRLVSGDATVAELEEARRWRRQSPSHEAAFVQAARLWDRLGPAGRNLLERTGRPLPSRARPVGRRALLGGAAAVSVAAAAYLVLDPPLGLWPSLSALMAQYRTGIGEQRRLTVADGVSLEMNTATSINILSAAPNALRIELVAGETAIATATGGAQSTGAKSIQVIAGDGQTSASWTSTDQARLNIRHDGPQVCVSCLAGEVLVQRRGRTAALQAPRQVSYAGDGLATPVAVDPAVISAWQDGLLIFHGTPLAEVVAEINRYRPGRILLLNAALGRRPVNARFHIDHADEMMTLVRQVFGAEVRSLPGGLVLLS